MVHGEIIELQSQGFSELTNVTKHVQQILARSGADSGIVNIFVIGSTASVSTIEFEPALNADMRDKLEQLVPSTEPSRHSETWGDDNGFSHMRATLMGPGINVPFVEGRLILGTWQQIVVIDHDNRPRERKLHVQVMGE
jgi:secondary thiamine-phosphate synthase enzyme